MDKLAQSLGNLKMKKILSHLLILTILLGVFAPVFVTAQGTGGTVNPTVGQIDRSNDTECGWLSGWGTCVINALTDIFTWLLYNIVLRIASWVLYLSGTLLDYVLRYTIIDLKVNLDDLTGINITWKVIKDLMNIAFIFILVYKGIELIIGVGSKESIKKFISTLILAALLVNFSLFFTKILIDASNIVTLGFYKSIIQSAGQGKPIVDQSGQTIIPLSGISIPFMKNLGLSSFWSKANFTNVRTGGDANMLLVPILGAVLFMVTAFVFFSISIIFIIRYVTLIILLILSPVAYMGTAIPGLGKAAGEWWETLTGQLTFGPIYMIMTWVVLQLMSTSRFLIDPDAIGRLASGDAGQLSATYSQSSISLIFNFVILIGLIIASLTVSKSSASRGSKFVGQATKNLTSYAGGKIMNVGALGLRNSVGLAGQSVANSQWLRERAPDSRLARLALTAGNKTGSASFDVRSTAIGKMTGMGKAGGKGGYQAEREARINDRMKFAENNLGDTVTGADVEAEMERRGWDKVSNEGRVNAYVVAGRSRADATAMVAREAERERERYQRLLIQGAERNTAERRQRYIHNISQTQWYTPNLYTGVSEDAEAARRMREGKKSKKGGKDKILADLAEVLKEEEPAAPAPAAPAPAQATPTP